MSDGRGTLEWDDNLLRVSRRTEPAESRLPAVLAARQFACGLLSFCARSTTVRVDGPVLLDKFRALSAGLLISQDPSSRGWTFKLFEWLTSQRSCRIFDGCNFGLWDDISSLNMTEEMSEAGCMGR